MKNMNNEVKEKWGNTEAYKEHQEKTKNYSKDTWESLAKGLESLLNEFSILMNNGVKSDSEDSLNLVKKLQDFISENYYTCTVEILYGLGQMYVCDDRFKKNIDKFGMGTAEYIQSAINSYCNK
jgi:hypothetical protein